MRCRILWLLLATIMILTTFADHSDGEHDDETHDDHNEHDDHDHGEHDKSTSTMLKALGITSLSGCAALLGFCFIFCLNRDQASLIPISLGFSGGVIVYLTFMNLIPEGIELLHHANGQESQAMAHFYATLCIIGGLLMSLSIEMVVPHDHGHHHPAVAAEPQVISSIELEDRYESPRLEHGRESIHSKAPISSISAIESKNTKQRRMSLPRVSYSVAIALILHHLPEGMAAFISLYYDLEFGILVSFALAIHDLPSGVCIALPTYLATGSKLKPFLLCLLAAFAYFLGGMLGWVIIVFATDQFVDSFVGVMFGITSGVMLYVAFVEILPTAIVAANRSREVESVPNGEDGHHDHGQSRVYLATIVGIFLGFLVMDVGNILLEESGGHSH